MSSRARETAVHEARAERGGDSIERYLEHIPVAFAVTSGSRHALVYGNAAFRALVARHGQPARGSPITDAFAGSDAAGLTAVLDRAFRTGVVARNRHLRASIGQTGRLSCTVWPSVDGHGEAEHLLVELRVTTQPELTLSLQREVAERILLGALREQDIADIAEEHRRGSAFLADESRRLGASLDEGATLQAMTRMSLPRIGAWSIVDLLGDDDAMHRLAIVHPDPAKQALVRELRDRWEPQPGDEFGLPAMLRRAEPAMLNDDADSVVGRATHDPETLRVLRELGVGPLLTVPLLIHDRLVGAVTFVGARTDPPYTPDDVDLATNLAGRSATALDRARLHGEAIALKHEAESANAAKTAFLGSLSHELLTPLNAISGFRQLIETGVHGPVTDEQKADLARIKANQVHLVSLIQDLLNFAKLDSGEPMMDVSDVVVLHALRASVGLVEPMMTAKQLAHDTIFCDAAIAVRADPDKLNQILVNLLSNAIKFTPSGGRIAMYCESADDTVRIRVVDTGIGIPADKLEEIFDPFVQVRGSLAGRDSGVGLGLSISRSLARALGGDLTVESTLGTGTQFTLTLPRAR